MPESCPCFRASYCCPGDYCSRFFYARQHFTAVLVDEARPQHSANELNVLAIVCFIVLMFYLLVCLDMQGQAACLLHWVDIYEKSDKLLIASLWAFGEALILLASTELYLCQADEGSFALLMHSYVITLQCGLLLNCSPHADSRCACHFCSHFVTLVWVGLVHCTNLPTKRQEPQLRVPNVSTGTCCKLMYNARNCPRLAAGSLLRLLCCCSLLLPAAGGSGGGGQEAEVKQTSWVAAAIVEARCWRCVPTGRN
jgi:hypothetical protein